MTGPAVDLHPFRAAWQTRDLNILAEALAPDVVLHSPMLTSSFAGWETAVELYGVLFDAFDAFEITEEFSEPDSYVFFWRGDLGGRSIEGVDLIRHRRDGKIAEVRVMIRPLAGIAAFAAGTGPALAAKRGRTRALLLRLLTPPLRVMIAIADAVAPRLVQRR